MNMIIHNLKIALRNFLKYKVQTLVSILALAIGMVTLSVVHSALQNFRLPEICNEPYYDRAYTISFDSIQPRQSQEDIRLNGDIVRALKSNGGLTCIEQGPYAPNGLATGGWAEFTLCNGEKRKMQIDAIALDRHYPNYAGLHSAISKEKIKVLKPHEAIVSMSMARQIFGDVNPVGARLQLNHEGQNFQLTVVDVYQDLSNNERALRNNSLFFSPCELEDMDFEYYYSTCVDVVLKEHATAEQLEAEANVHLKALGMKAKVESLKETMSGENTSMRIGVMIAYLIGSLILLAAVIGFLKMQTQLFWMRRREISLRITNGATRRQLFSMFATEVALVIGLACVVAMVMDIWVYDFMVTRLADMFESSMENMDKFNLNTIVIAVGVLILCLAVVWVILQRICKSGQGLDTVMRKNHSHWFRNMMLGIQIAISTFFLCTTFGFLNLSDKLKEFNNIPNDERVYKESLYLQTHEADDQQRLRDHLTKLPEVEKCIPYSRGFYRVDELTENETFSKTISQYGDVTFRGMITHYQTHFVSDKSWLDFFHVKVNWKPNANRTKCVLVNEVLYQKMRQQGVAPNEMLTIETEGILPISGTFASIPYQNHDMNDQYSFIVIDPRMRFDSEEYILVPKSGEYNAMKTTVEKTIRELEPAVDKNMAVNLRENLATEMGTLEVLRIAITILAIVSFVICLMSIFSTVMLDMRGRRREVAIRKVNGALMPDIAKLFGRVYVVIGIISILFAVILTVLFHVVVLNNFFWVVTVNPVLPIISGILVVVLFITGIIVWQVWRIMKIDPSEILVKE